MFIYAPLQIILWTTGSAWGTLWDTGSRKEGSKGCLPTGVGGRGHLHWATDVLSAQPPGSLHLGVGAAICSDWAAFCEKLWEDQPGWLAGAVPRVPRCTWAPKEGAQLGFTASLEVWFFWWSSTLPPTSLWCILLHLVAREKAHCGTASSLTVSACHLLPLGTCNCFHGNRTMDCFPRNVSI